MMTIEKIPVRLSPDMGEQIKEAKRWGRFYAFHIDARNGGFGFFETFSEDIFDFQQRTHSDWVYPETISIEGKIYTIIKGRKDGDDDPDWKLSAIDTDRNLRICESFIIIGRHGKEDGLTVKDMKMILSRMRIVKFGRDDEYYVLVVD